MSYANRSLILVALVAAVTGGSVLLTRSTRASGDLQASDVNVSCAPSQRALVRQTIEGSFPRVDVLCVDAESAVPAGYGERGGGLITPVAYTRPTPASYDMPARPAPVRTPRAVSSSPSRSTAARTETKPSWQKRAIIIGGSAGAGAGIGALAGGKKGALIGAAIGGGGAAILDQVKNK